MRNYIYSFYYIEPFRTFPDLISITVAICDVFLACYGDYYMFYLISSWLCEFAWRNNWIFNLYFVSREILDSSEVGIEITWHFYARLFDRITLIQIFDILIKSVWLNILIWYFRQMWSDNLVRCMYFLWTVLINNCDQQFCDWQSLIGSRKLDRTFWLKHIVQITWLNSFVEYFEFITLN